MDTRPAASLAVMAMMLTTLAACAGAPRQRPVEMGPVDTGPRTLTAARKFLEGRWVLESFEMYAGAKGPIPLKGSGTLLYDEFGNMRMEIRADQASSDMLRAAGIDIRDGVISTDGRTAIDLQNRTLTYIVKTQDPLIPGPLSLNRPRYWEVKDDTLTLTTKDDTGKPLSVGRWKKSQ